MDTERTSESDKRKPVMLLGRDITKIPCFKRSMLNGIYTGIGSGLVTFLLTSRPRRALEVALGAYMSVSLVYWCHCRYTYVKQKYQLNDIKALQQQQSVNKEIEETEVEQKGKLVNA
ncbi:hypothetical protein DMN91_010759 [Ooceraea biroi]|uniref:Cytochrome c oxidase assembly protein COX20, mitochondrial n=1 Tax=Ooceraea biroi TaxID=2015173 RepID=A0A026X219_OOCBI|nr:cytochrome c oxidase assembly protein COX20, mitochondrial [Ooceraea biroi]XP_026829574.1 cytochrome c oxidase assembly protein COX20, mitochondrial-like [Ooceraea biroi]EZA62360.1 hypothetical protein X777_03394 [Ooceraea biroi]RLU16514.1 hypothetical protein DMN91_010582 [Ooceraea biroi]RLU16691.1 hypothetical protein DMN91_010759 [Ooceraea biroi]